MSFLLIGLIFSPFPDAREGQKDREEGSDKEEQRRQKGRGRQTYLRHETQAFVCRKKKTRKDGQTIIISLLPVGLIQGVDDMVCVMYVCFGSSQNS